MPLDDDLKALGINADTVVMPVPVADERYPAIAALAETLMIAMAGLRDANGLAQYLRFAENYNEHARLSFALAAELHSQGYRKAVD